MPKNSYKNAPGIPKGYMREGLPNGYVLLMVKLSTGESKLAVSKAGVEFERCYRKNIKQDAEREGFFYYPVKNGVALQVGISRYREQYFSGDLNDHNASSKPDFFQDEGRHLVSVTSLGSFCINSWNNRAMVNELLEEPLNESCHFTIVSIYELCMLEIIKVLETPEAKRVLLEHDNIVFPNELMCYGRCFGDDIGIQVRMKEYIRTKFPAVAVMCDFARKVKQSQAFLELNDIYKDALDKLCFIQQYPGLDKFKGWMLGRKDTHLTKTQQNALFIIWEKILEILDLSKGPVDMDKVDPSNNLSQHLEVFFKQRPELFGKEQIAAYHEKLPQIKIDMKLCYQHERSRRHQYR